LAEYGRGRLADLIRFVVDLLAGLPSIVVGVFVWAWLVRQVVGNFSGLAGAVALASIIIPIVPRSAAELIRSVPDSLRQAAGALVLIAVIGCFSLLTRLFSARRN